MNEKTVGSDFLKKLRAELPHAVVIKHHDASLIGLPDASYTWNKETWWLEFKLVDRSLDLLSCEKVAAKSPVQFAMMKRLANVGRALYVFFDRAGYVTFWNPLGDHLEVCTKKDAPRHFVELLYRLRAL